MKNFEFPCGDLSLDFLGTLQRRDDPQPLEFLTSPARADAWLREAGVIDDDAGFDDTGLDDAFRLREAIYALFTARLASRPFPADALEQVNATAQASPVTPTLTPHGRRIDATPAQALSTIARDAIDILSRDDVRVKRCGNEGCTQIYVDHSRAGNREWCAMDPCGNRIKARAYRARKAAA